VDPMVKETLTGLKDGERVEVIEKNGKITEIKPVKDVDKANKAEYQMARDLVVERLKSQGIKREPTEKEIHDQILEDKKSVAKAGASGREAGKPQGGMADSFSKWSKEDKEWWFETKKSTGEKPDFGWGKDAAKSRAQFAKEYAQWAQGKGISGREAGTAKESFKADSQSLKFITKQLDASDSFTKTIDNNISQLERHIEKMSKTLNLDRNRLLNMGTREFNKKLIGTANINIYEMLTAAISTENAKLQAGGAGSVAMVAEGARTEMRKIHDDNLPVSEMLKLMKATREEGGNRIKGLRDQRNEIQTRMKGDKGETGKSPYPQTVQYLRDNKDKYSQEDLLRQIMKANPKMTKQEIGQAWAEARGQ